MTSESTNIALSEADSRFAELFKNWRTHYLATAHHADLPALDLGEVIPPEDDADEPVSLPSLYETALDRLPICESFYQFERGPPELKEIIRNFQYRMTVEWDQRDEKQRADILESS